MWDCKWTNFIYDNRRAWRQLCELLKRLSNTFIYLITPPARLDSCTSLQNQSRNVPQKWAWTFSSTKWTRSEWSSVLVAWSDCKLRSGVPESQNHSFYPHYSKSVKQRLLRERSLRPKPNVLESFLAWPFTSFRKSLNQSCLSPIPRWQIGLFRSGWFNRRIGKGDHHSQSTISRCTWECKIWYLALYLVVGFLFDVTIL